MAEKGRHTDEMVQVWTTIPLQLRKAAEKYAVKDYIKPSELYRRAIIKELKLYMEGGK